MTNATYTLIVQPHNGMWYKYPSWLLWYLINNPKYVHTLSMYAVYCVGVYLVNRAACGIHKTNQCVFECVFVIRIAVIRVIHHHNVCWFSQQLEPVHNQQQVESSLPVQAVAVSMTASALSSYW